MKFTKILKKITYFVLVFAVMSGVIFEYSPNVKTYADEVSDIKDKIDELKAQNDEREGQISQIADILAEQEAYQTLVSEKLAIQKQILDSLNNKIYYKQLDIDENQGKIDELSKKITAAELAIQNKQKDIDKLDEKNKENLETFAEIVKALYVSGNTDVIAILSGANDFYDFMVRSEVVSNISKQNMEFMNQLLKDIKDAKAMMKQLETDKSILEENKKVLETEKAKLEKEKEDILIDQQESAYEAEQYQNDYNNYADTISELDEKVGEIQSEIIASQADIERFEEELKATIISQTKPNKEYVGGDWAWPVQGMSYISCYFGWDEDFGRVHKGVDVGDGGIWGTPIIASKSGTVIVAEHYYIPGYSYGKYVVLDHGGGFTSTYAHCDDIYVSVGQEVSQGDTIATVGNTGYSTGPHLHFEIRENGEPLNPLDLTSP